MTKPELRKKYTQLRDSLSVEDYKNGNLQLANSFISHILLDGVNVVHTFLPMFKKKEPDTFLIVEGLRMNYPSIRISIPWINQKTQQLDPVYFEPHHSAENNSWGIPEVMGEATLPADIDMVIVPLLAFDLSGHRVGYGKGYYDKFLATCRKDVRKVGLSFFPAEPSIEGLSQHDIPLDFCLTPKQNYVF